MILVFGGTTEGRRAIKALEAAGRPYYYSTKTGEQQVGMVHGLRTDGAMDREAMARFCRSNGIRLIVDAAHPFATRLHQTIGEVATLLRLPIVRFERIYPPRDPDILWIDDYREVPADVLLGHPRPTLLATTGVQSIARLRWLEERGVSVLYRILRRPSSLRLALGQGDYKPVEPPPLALPATSVNDGATRADDQDIAPSATEEYVWVGRDDGAPSPRTCFLLLKESGLTGGFPEKVRAARERGMRIIALRRPPLPYTPTALTLTAQRPSPLTSHPLPLSPVIVDGEYGLRRAVEHILPDFYPLRSGLTTGTCATAAAVAATLMLLRREHGAPTASTPHGHSPTLPAEMPALSVHSPALPAEVPVRLPNGETILVPVGYGDGYAYVLKESGDDPDVTNGIEIRARANPLGRDTSRPYQLRLIAGEGIGHFTLPGFDFPPGEPAINRVPRQMIRDNIALLLGSSPKIGEVARSDGGVCQPPSPGPSAPTDEAKPPSSIINYQLSIEISVPDGQAIARRTFNPRLGIEGGISIIGVSGIVMPYSEEAFKDSIHRCLTVARASGSPRIVIGSGMKSESQLRRLYPDLPPQAFVEYGNYVGDTIRMASELGIHNLTLGIMIGKAVKLAQGHLDTHSRRTVMDKAFVAQLLREAHCPSSIINCQLPRLTVARELWDILSPPEAQRLTDVIIRHCRQHCAPLLPGGELTILLLRNE